MNLMDKILLGMYMLLMVFISLCIIIIPFNIIPYNIINTILINFSNNILYSLIGLILLFVSIKLLLSTIISQKKENINITKVGEFGELKISGATFETLSIKIIKQINGIKEYKVSVGTDIDGVIINAKLLVLPDINIPQLTAEVQTKIKNYIEAITEISVKQIKVTIDNIALSTTAVISKEV